MDDKERIAELEKENAYLKEELRKRGFFYIKPGELLNKQEKIGIFLSYFKGRPDVYAKRYYSMKTQSYGWNPACTMEFQPGCKKGKIKNYCGRCPVAKFSVLDEQTLNDHFRGEHKNIGSGIYPLLSDNTCHLLAFDFDDDYWFENLLSVHRVALQHNIISLMERSSSGRGGHLWLFFSEPIKALKARKLGTLFLQEAMENNLHMNFDSYDRLFPNQDYIPQGGFVNLIALPLRYDAYKKGNTAFINDMQQVIEHPIEYLASIPKIKEKLIDEILSIYEKKDYFFEEDQLALPLDGDVMYTKDIYGKETTWLCIEKKNLSRYTQVLLHRLGSMNNPEYYLMQKLRKPI